MFLDGFSIYSRKRIMSTIPFINYMQQCIQEWPKKKFVGDSLLKNWSDMVCLNRAHYFRFFTGCLWQIVLGPFLNTSYIHCNHKTLGFLILAILLRVCSTEHLISWLQKIKALDYCNNFLHYIINAITTRADNNQIRTRNQ